MVYQILKQIKCAAATATATDAYVLVIFYDLFNTRFVSQRRFHLAMSYSVQIVCL